MFDYSRVLKRLGTPKRRVAKKVPKRKGDGGGDRGERRLLCEQLEARALLSAVHGPGAGTHFDKTPTGLTPNEIRGAYGLGSYTSGVLSGGISFNGIPGDGRGQTIAIVDAYDYPTALADVNAFSAYYGLPQFNVSGGPTFQRLNQEGQTSPLPGTDPLGPGGDDWEGEESLDIDWAHAIAPMANIDLFEANSGDSSSFADLFTAVKSAANTPGVVVVSMSFGQEEDDFNGSVSGNGVEANDNSSIFVTPSGHLGGAATLGGMEIAGGVTFLASAGDSGAYLQFTQEILPDYPAASSNVVAVGGTTLSVGGTSPNFNYGGETAWGEGTDTSVTSLSGYSGTTGGGGGGVSLYESQPSFQSGVVSASLSSDEGVYTTAHRTYPDIAADANPNTGVPVYDSYDNGSNSPWSGFNGGTSLACPMCAAMVAIADEGRAIEGVGSLYGNTQTLPALYSLPSTDFNDITQGSTGPSPEFAAGPGYDLTTGRGSPVGNLLIPALAAYGTSSSSSPTVTAISPTTGPAAGGTFVTITGTNLTGATAVDFGSTPATNVVVDSSTEITATSPAGTGVVDVTVTTSSGTSADTSADQFTYSVSGPAVTGVTPDAGPLAGGTLVTITGTSLASAAAVDFGANPATIITDTASRITALDPAGTGTVDVTVTTSSGTSATSTADQFTYETTPTVTGVTPASGSTDGGTTVTITGTGLSGATAVDFGTTAATIVSDSNTQIVVTTSAAAAGKVNVTVVTPAGTSPTSSSDQYTYVVLPPTVTGVNPPFGPLAGGTSVTITGTSLLGATAVDFCGTPGKIVSDTAGQIVATSPAGSGTVNVTVITVGGTSAISTADQFTYLPPPTVTGISPNTGPTTGKTSVAIAGTNLEGATAVDFGGVAGTIVSDNAVQVVANSPPGAAGTVNVTVVTPGGTSATSSIDQFAYYVPAPTVTGIAPSDGTVAGGTRVTIKGTNLSAATAVDFGGVAAKIDTDTTTQIVVNSPAGSLGTVDVTVVTAGGTSATSSADQFTYENTPSVTSISPISGSDLGGTPVTITGTNLSDAIVVDFGTVSAKVTSDTDSQIVAVSPAGALGTVDVTVVTPNGTSATGSGDLFTYTVPPPAVTGITPVAGPPAGGTVVTITGTNFTGATAVDFGGVASPNVTVESGTEIVASSPAGSGTVDVTVTTATGTSAVSTADQFSFVSVATATTVTTPDTAGSYIEYSPIPILVTFNEAVYVYGNPQITLNAGSGVTANYTGGNGTPTLSFVYTVEPGQTASDLDYTSTSALLLNGGSITDVLGNAVDLTLPATGTDGLATAGIAVVPSSDNFSSGGLGTLPWQTSGLGSTGASWFVQSGAGPGGSYAAEAGGDGGQSGSLLSVTLTGTAGELSFLRRVSSLQGSGYMIFEIDGVPLSQWSGDVTWQQSFYYVSAGTHTYTWLYSNAGPETGLNSAFLADVAFSPGRTLTVDGTGGNDQFSFSAAGSSVVVSLNGEIQSFAPGDFNSYVFVGSGSGEFASIEGGSSGVNTAILYANGNGQLVNTTEGFTFTASGMASMHVYGNAADTAEFYDTTAADTFYSYADYANSDQQLSGMLGSNYSNSASGFGTNIGISAGGGKDIAGFFDAPGTNTYYAYADYGGAPSGSGKSLAGMIGSGYSNTAKGFAMNAAYAVNGGGDTSVFYDAPGTNTFYSYADYNHTGTQLAGMLGNFGGGFSDSASGFAVNKGYATLGSSDTAVFFDSAGNDTFFAYGNYENSGKQYAGMTGTGYSNSASGFGTNIGVSENGGTDTADLYNTSANDTLYTDLAIAELYANSGAYGEEAEGFAVVNVNGSAGGTNTRIKGAGLLSYELNLIGPWSNV
jgi:subtilase family serine protease